MEEVLTVKHRKLKITMVCIVILLVICADSFFIYTSDYSRARQDAIAALQGTPVSVTEFNGGIAFGDPAAEVGFIFYPGGKVEYAAYAPLLQKISEAGYLCILVKMPFNLAVFDINAADRMISRYPTVKRWFLGGHSLGGSMAAEYGAKNPRKIAGLVLLAAYPVSDLASSGFPVLTLYGSKDKVLNAKKLAEGRTLMPARYQEIRIDGGNHAQFGDYGPQKGDGKATISAKQQREITAEAIRNFFVVFSSHS